MDMDDIVQDAIIHTEKKKSKKSERPTKRRKVSENKEVRIYDSDNETKNAEDTGQKIKKMELKSLLMKYGDVDIDDLESIQSKIDSFDDEKLERYLDHVKYKVGLYSPNESAKSLVGIVSLFLARRLGDRDLHTKIMSDDNLINVTQHLFPNFIGEMNIPLQVTYKFATHIANSIFGEKTIE